MDKESYSPVMDQAECLSILEMEDNFCCHESEWNTPEWYAVNKYGLAAVEVNWTFLGYQTKFHLIADCVEILQCFVESGKVIVGVTPVMFVINDELMFQLDQLTFH